MAGRMASVNDGGVVTVREDALGIVQDVSCETAEEYYHQVLAGLNTKSVEEIPFYMVEREDPDDPMSPFQCRVDNAPRLPPPMPDLLVTAGPSSQEAQSNSQIFWQEFEKDTDEIKYTDNIVGVSRVIKCATLEKLVERLTWEVQPDINFVLAFMLTYRSFTTPMELFGHLVARFMLQPTPEEDPETFRTDKQLPIRLRVVNVLKTWIDKHFYDFEEDTELTESFLAFISETMVAEGMEVPSAQLQKLYNSQLTGDRKRRQTHGMETAPVPVSPETPDFEDFDLLEVARQLTVIEFELYKQIRPKELIALNWTKRNKQDLSPNVLQMIDRFNVVSEWVATMVVTGGETAKERAGVIKKLIVLANHLLDLHNFNGVMEVISGLEASAIYRLKKTWKAVDKRTLGAFEDLKERFGQSGNYRVYRELLKSVNPPCIPYLGVYLTDLTFVEEGNKDVVEGLISWGKRVKVAGVISDVQQYQQTPYFLHAEPTIANFLTSFTPLNEADQYSESLRVEPRDRNGTLRRGSSVSSVGAGTSANGSTSDLNSLVPSLPNM